MSKRTIIYRNVAARMALRQKQEKSCGLADFVKICLSWGIGYAGMWSGKWLMAALLTGHRKDNQFSGY